MKTTFRQVALVALALIAGCAPKPPHERDPFGLTKTPVEREANATVVILDPNNYGGHCSGVSVNDRGVTRILTAAHCVTHLDNPYDISPWPIKVANLGDTIFFVPRDGTVKRQVACVGSIAMFDPDRDLAWVDADDPSDLPSPLPVKPFCERCQLTDETVHAVSGLYAYTTHYGYVIGQTFESNARFWASTLDIQYGWSGSPVLNDSGYVVGVISKCTPDIGPDGEKQCKPGWSLFAGAPN